MPFHTFSLVLVEPKAAANMGAVARAMKNFGFSSLRLVRPRADHLSPAARNLAVSAADLLEQARVYDSLGEALADSQFSLGTSRRFGKYRSEFLLPAQAAEAIAARASLRTALVFGREESGLTTAELDLCQGLLTIPTHDSLPSMNLAQAVTVCLYELSRQTGSVPVPAEAERQPADGETLEAMFAHMRQTLLAAGFLDPQNPDHLLRDFRRMLGHQGVSKRDVRIVRGLLGRIDWLRERAEAGAMPDNSRLPDGAGDLPGQEEERRREQSGNSPGRIGEHA